ncbi:T9SS type A sorting domain-containing protein [Psychroserpens sp. Hel_I_66]|uniref:T9SS type A sorting domain-containing protein n=1 Tax=Psychroserpens sp. Hel_I_66 TaxID=1250004 RepID=UPI00064813B2|nr:T9SS type A sorting domain-containing protein [Psychroserpens sp. Hel_I_66]
MKTKLLLIIIFIISNATAQQQAPPVPETWETDIWLGTEWKHISTVDYTFNSACLPNYALLQALDFPTDMFVNSIQLEISYNANSQMETSTNELWDVNLQDWVNDRRSDFTYIGNNLTLIEIYIWENDDWQINETIENTYNSSNLLVEALYQEWDVMSSSLVNREKNDFTYTAFPQIDTIVNSTWDIDNSIWISNSRVIYVYNSNDMVSSEISQNWNTIEWINNNLETYTYDGNGFLIECLKSDWNPSTTVYEPTQREFYTNNSEGSPTVVVDQANIFGTWTNTTRDRRTYPSCQTLDIEEVVFVDFEIYPNPVQDQLIVKTSLNSAITIEVLDINGRLIHAQSLTDSINKVDLSGLNSGMYLLRISHDKSIFTKKIIKQ